MSKVKYWDVYRAVRDTRQVHDHNDVRRALQRSSLSKLQAILLDRKYWSLSLNAWKKVLSYNGTDRNKYIRESFDCDNFAMLFSGSVAQRWAINGAGVVVDYSGRHAYNCILVSDENSLTVSIIEPQTDNFVINTSGLYNAERGFLIYA